MRLPLPCVAPISVLEITVTVGAQSQPLEPSASDGPSLRRQTRRLTFSISELHESSSTGIGFRRELDKRRFQSSSLLSATHLLLCIRHWPWKEALHYSSVAVETCCLMPIQTLRRRRGYRRV